MTTTITAKVYPELKGTDRVIENCGRCGGSGYIGSYAHIENGRCFECDGQGQWSVLVSSVRARVRRRELAQQAEERKAAETQARIEKFKIDNPQLTEVIEMELDFVSSIKGQIGRGKELSEKQMAALHKIIKAQEDRAAEEKAAAPVPTGRVEIIGEVISTKEVPNAYSRSTDLKWIVKSETGFRLYGTVPNSVAYDVKIGSRVSFTATCKPSADDPKFGFASRPTKAQIVS